MKSMIMEGCVLVRGRGMGSAGIVWKESWEGTWCGGRCSGRCSGLCVKALAEMKAVIVWTFRCIIGIVCCLWEYR